MLKDLTTGSPLRLIVLFTLPLLMGNFFQQLYQFTDAIVVGQFISVDAFAAIGGTGSVTFLLIGFTWGSSTGLTIPVAKAYGAGDTAELRRSVAAGIYVSIVITASVTAIGVLGCRSLLQLLNTPPELLDLATSFLRIIFGYVFVIVAFNYLSSLLRALGDSRTPLIFLVATSLVNAGLSVFFVGVCRWGVAGAAWATVIAQALADIGFLIVIAKRVPVLHVQPEDWHLSAVYVWRRAKLGLAMGFQTSIIAIGTLILQSAVNSLGSSAVASFASGMRVDQLASTPLNSVGLALSTFVAQNRGAKQWRRIRVGVWQTCLIAVFVAITLGAVNIIFGTSIVRLFVGAEESVIAANAHQYLIVQGTTYVVLGLLFALRGTIQGMGKSAIPTIAGIMELAFRCLAAWVLVAHFGWLGVCWGSPLAWAGSLATLVPAWFVLRRRLIRQESSPIQSTAVFQI